MLEELSILRTVVLGELVEHAGGDLLLHQRTHVFLDDLVRVSTLRFADQQQGEIASISASRLGLLRTISHEVRNAVNAIQLVREVQRETAGASVDPLQGTLDRTVLHLRTMLDNLLDVMRTSQGPVAFQWQQVDPRELAVDLESTYRKAAEDAGLAFTVTVEPTLGVIESDLTSLRQVSGNFLSNALKYTPSGGLELRMLDQGEDTWMLEVTDTGMGVGDEAKGKLFEEFYRAPGTEAIHGTGLGLAITKRLVESLGGTVLVTSVEGKGSTFAARLPKRRRPVEGSDVSPT